MVFPHLFGLVRAIWYASLGSPRGFWTLASASVLPLLTLGPQVWGVGHRHVKRWRAYLWGDTKDQEKVWKPKLEKAELQSRKGRRVCFLCLPAAGFGRRFRSDERHQQASWLQYHPCLPTFSLPTYVLPRMLCSSCGPGMPCTSRGI